MPISPHRLKIPRTAHPDLPDLFEINQPKNVSFLKKLFCFFYRHKFEIVLQGYPRWKMHFHVHYRCQICGHEKLFKDITAPRRQKKHFPKRNAVIMFSRPE